MYLVCKNGLEINMIEYGSLITLLLNSQNYDKSIDMISLSFSYQNC